MTIQGVTFSLSNIDIMYNSHFSNLNRSSNYGRLQVSAVNEQIDVMRRAINLSEKYRAVRDIQILTAEQYYKIPCTAPMSFPSPGPTGSTAGRPTRGNRLQSDIAAELAPGLISRRPIFRP